jgi:hypothetical protein
VRRCYPNPNTIALEYQPPRYSDLAFASTFCQEQDTAIDHHEGPQNVASVLRTMAKNRCTRRGFNAQRGWFFKSKP